MGPPQLPDLDALLATALQDALAKSRDPCTLKGSGLTTSPLLRGSEPGGCPVFCGGGILMWALVMGNPE